MSKVATTGAYGDLSGQPTLGTAAAQPTTAFDAAGAASTVQANLTSEASTARAAESAANTAAIAAFPTVTFSNFPSAQPARGIVLQSDWISDSTCTAGSGTARADGQTRPCQWVSSGVYKLFDGVTAEKSKPGALVPNGMISADAVGLVPVPLLPASVVPDAGTNQVPNLYSFALVRQILSVGAAGTFDSTCTGVGNSITTDPVTGQKVMLFGGFNSTTCDYTSQGSSVGNGQIGIARSSDG